MFIITLKFIAEGRKEQVMNCLSYNTQSFSNIFAAFFLSIIIVISMVAEISFLGLIVLAVAGLVIIIRSSKNKFISVREPIS